MLKFETTECPGDTVCSKIFVDFEKERKKERKKEMYKKRNMNKK